MQAANRIAERLGNTLNQFLVWTGYFEYGLSDVELSEVRKSAAIVRETSAGLVEAGSPLAFTPVILSSPEPCGYCRSRQWLLIHSTRHPRPACFVCWGKAWARAVVKMEQEGRADEE